MYRIKFHMLYYIIHSQNHHLISTNYHNKNHMNFHQNKFHNYFSIINRLLMYLSYNTHHYNRNLELFYLYLNKIYKFHYQHIRYICSYNQHIPNHFTINQNHMTLLDNYYIKHSQNFQESVQQKAVHFY